MPVDVAPAAPTVCVMSLDSFGEVLSKGPARESGRPFASGGAAAPWRPLFREHAPGSASCMMLTSKAVRSSVVSGEDLGCSGGSGCGPSNGEGIPYQICPSQDGHFAPGDEGG